MNLSEMRFPRQLEADGTAGIVRQALMARTVELWSGGDLHVSVITMSGPLTKMLRAANLNGHIRCGFEAISDKLEKEQMGIARVRERKGAPYGDRVSRLLLFSNDGAERFCRHIEHLIQSHAPRLLGCLLDIDGWTLGSLITNEDRVIKVIMVEHKEVVSGVLRTIATGQGS